MLRQNSSSIYVIEVDPSADAKKRKHDACVALGLITGSAIGLLLGANSWSAVGPYGPGIMGEPINVTMISSIILTTAAVGIHLRHRDSNTKSQVKQCCNVFFDFIRTAILAAVGTIPIVFGREYKKSNNQDGSIVLKPDKDGQIHIQAYIYAGIFYLASAYFLFLGSRDANYLCNKPYSSKKMIDGVLDIVIKDGRTLSIIDVADELKDLLKKNTSEDIAKARLTFNNGINILKDILEVEMHRNGARNYVTKQGINNISTTIKINGEEKEIKIRLKSTGEIEFTKKKDRLKFNANKMDFSSNIVYVGGIKLQDTLRQGKWKEITHPQTTVFEIDTPENIHDEQPMIV
jgi:hypothetical protein